LDEQNPLTDERSDAIVQAVVQAVQKDLGARLRGA